MFRRIILLFAFALGHAEAVILFRTGDPNENTTAPTGDLAGSGWQYQGLWGGFLGTPIAPRYFISAGHFGDPPELLLDSTTYHVVRVFADPASDLKVLQVAEEFPAFAPLYSRLDEVGQRIAEFGRGTQRGSEIVLESLRGWNWGPADFVKRWGENTVNRIVPHGTNNDLLAADFDQIGLPNECHLSAFDSGGAAFINDSGTWKLAGINFAVDEVYTEASDASQLTAALFDARDYFTKENGNFVLITGDNPVPTSFYATRISRRLPWIASIIAEPVIAREGAVVSLTYTRFILPANDVTYTVEQSPSLVAWSPATTMDEIISTNGSVQTVKATISGAASPLFLRLRTSRP